MQGQNAESMDVQADNGPKHISALVKDFKIKWKLRSLMWPSWSPDLIPIDPLWEQVEPSLMGIKPSNK